jgi:hypothetical protein
MRRFGFGTSRISIRALGAASVVVTALLATTTSASARPDPNHDEPVSSGPTSAGANGSVDLATATADRWIVQLDEASVASRAASDTKLDVSTPDNVSYRGALEARQNSFRQTLRQVAPSSKVERTYQVALNGLAVKMSPQEAAAVREVDGVRAVTPDIPMHLDMYDPADRRADAVEPGRRPEQCRRGCEGGRHRQRHLRNPRRRRPLRRQRVFRRPGLQGAGRLPEG